MIPLIFVFIKCKNLILIIKIKKFMDPHDDQNQEFRRLDSKMIEDSKSEDLLIKDSNSQAMRS